MQQFVCGTGIEITLLMAEDTNEQDDSLRIVTYILDLIHESLWTNKIRMQTWNCCTCAAPAIGKGIVKGI